MQPAFCHTIKHSYFKMLFLLLHSRTVCYAEIDNQENPRVDALVSCVRGVWGHPLRGISPRNSVGAKIMGPQMLTL